jgi:hypothetical protein
VLVAAERRKMRTPRTGKRRGSSNNYDDDSNSSGGNSNLGALIISAVLKLGDEIKVGRVETKNAWIGQYIDSLRQDVRAFNVRIAELKRLMHQHQIDMMETKSRNKKQMYAAFITDYNDELRDLSHQLEATTTAVRDLLRTMKCISVFHGRQGIQLQSLVNC